MSQLTKPTTVDVEAYVKRLAEKYPDVLWVKLFGSRAKGTHSPFSDHDIIVCLHPRCYRKEIWPPETELQIFFDKELRPLAGSEEQIEIDLFFLRPGGKLTGNQLVIEDMLRVMDMTSERTEPFRFDSPLTGPMKTLFKRSGRRRRERKLWTVASSQT
jgi:predicted nucleotidyltransferase